LAELDMAEVVQARYDFDPVGHYARPDVFQLLVNERPMPPIASIPGSEPGSLDSHPGPPVESQDS
jgi:nitrilase